MKKEIKMIKLIFKLYSGTIIEIQTAEPYLISKVDNIQDLKLDKKDDVFRIE